MCVPTFLYPQSFRAELGRNGRNRNTFVLTGTNYGTVNTLVTFNITNVGEVYSENKIRSILRVRVNVASQFCLALIFKPMKHMVNFMYQR